MDIHYAFPYMRPMMMVSVLCVNPYMLPEAPALR